MKIKKILFILAGLFLLIQFYPMKKPKVVLENPTDFIRNNKVPESVVSILKTSCYDCHSNETTYPWYAKVAPIKWLIYNDVKEAREALNFSEWKSLSTDDKSDALFDIAEEVEEKEMPLKIYLYKHKNAKLSTKQIEYFTKYFENLAEEL